MNPTLYMLLIAVVPVAAALIIPPLYDLFSGDTSEIERALDENRVRNGPPAALGYR